LLRSRRNWQGYGWNGLLRSNAKNPTPKGLMITHKLVGLGHADEILVMRAGRIVARGQHLDLLQEDGWYRKWYDRQQQVFAR